MTTPPITAHEFRERVQALCRGGVGPGLPRARRDVHVLLRAVTMTLDPTETYAESALNEGLKGWLEAAGPRVIVDHVSLRRALVDKGYLVRDPAGSGYQVRREGHHVVTFDPGVDGLDILQILREMFARGEERRRKYSRVPPG